MPTRRCSLAALCLALCLPLAACPGTGGGGSQGAAASQAALAPRPPQLPAGWPLPQFKPADGMQQVKLTPQLLAAIAARNGAVTPTASGDGYEIDALDYKEGVQDDALAGLSGEATATGAPDATDRARPKRHGQCWLIACTAAGVDWDKLVADTQAALQQAGYHRIESGDGPEGEAARFINDDETSMAVLVHRVPRDDHQEFGVKEEFVYMACTLERKSDE